MLNSTKGQFLRITTFTSSGTWTKGNDVGSVLSKVVSGGGGSGYFSSSTAGGSSSFGSILSCTGGAKGGLTAGGSGGVATGGTVNINGQVGYAAASIALRSSPSISNYGAGGPNFNDGSGGTGGGGGAGAYAEKLIDESLLPSTVSITVGSGGSGGSGGVLGAGAPGIVIVYEYSK